MPAVAEVQFKATNSQQVVTAFKSVGTAAQDSSTKIQQNSGAMKSLGQGMKGSVSGIAQVGSAFATLSLSVVNTWRAYRDLGDAQLAVDRANTKLTKSEEKLNDLKKKAALLQKQANKGGIEEQRKSIEIAKARRAVAEAEKKYGKNSLEAADARLKVVEAENKGTDSGGKLAEVMKDIAIQEEVVKNNTFGANEAQERYNDTQQDFYLSILPTALSGLSTMTFALQGIKGMFAGGRGGLLGGFGAFGLILGGITLAIIAFKTNFLGFRDLVMGVIDFIRARFGDWQKTIQEVFDLIQKGDWGAAFERIKKAAIDFWNDLVHNVPFFGGINKIIDAIRNGKWDEAFKIISDAALKFWEDLKKQVPLIGKVEDVVNKIKEGKWQEAFDEIKRIAMESLGDIFGQDTVDKWVSQIESIPAIITANINMQKKGGKNKNIFAGTGILDDIIQLDQFDFDGVAKKFVENLFGGFEGVLDPTKAKGGFLTGGKDPGAMIVDYISGTIGSYALNVIDPFVKSLFDATTWTTALDSSSGRLSTVTKGFTDNFANQLSIDALSVSLFDFVWNFYEGLHDYFHQTFPQTTAIIENIVAALSSAVLAVPGTLANLGISIWNGIAEGIRQGMLGIADMLEQAAIQLGNSPEQAAKIWEPFRKMFQDPKWGKMDPIPIPAAIKPPNFTDMTKQMQPKGPIPVPTKPEIAPKEKQALKTQLDSVLGRDNKVKARIESQVLKDQLNQVFNKGYVVRVYPKTTDPRSRFYRGGQHGYQGTVKRPTLFLAGEGGRQEDISINPRGSKGGRGRGGGGGDVYVGPIYLGGEKIMDIIRYKMTENSSIFR